MGRAFFMSESLTVPAVLVLNKSDARLEFHFRSLLCGMAEMGAVLFLVNDGAVPPILALSLVRLKGVAVLLAVVWLSKSLVAKQVDIGLVAFGRGGGIERFSYSEMFNKI